MNVNLFPKREEWASGDEAIDQKLSFFLTKLIDDFSLEKLEEFFNYTKEVKKRVFNPSFHLQIQYLVKALLHRQNPQAYIDLEYVKFIGKYWKKKQNRISFHESDLIKNNLLEHSRYRYKELLDFSLQVKEKSERNPFVCHELPHSGRDFQVKIIFKDLKNYLLNEKSVGVKQYEIDILISALKLERNVILIENFAQLWFEDDQIYGLSLF